MTLTCTLALALTFATAAHAQNAPMLVGTVGDGNTLSGSVLYEIDPATGATVRKIGPVGYIVNGLEYDPSTQTLYASTSVRDPRYNGLIKIDLNTGAGTPAGINHWGVMDDCGYSAVTNITIDASGQLYGWIDPCSDDLVRINKSTGQATIIGNSGLGTGGNGLDFSTSGILYMTQGSALYKINPAAGTATYDGFISGGDSPHHGDFHPVTNLMYAPSRNSMRLNVINVVTKTATLLNTSLRFMVVEFIGAAPDTTAPVISGTPEPQTLEATGPDGAAASWTAPVATDDVDGSVSVDCSHASGATFPVGTTEVACSATDAAGNSASVSFTVTVNDTTAPTISGTPGNQVAEATGSAGATVSWASPSAYDLVAGTVSVSCSPASGSTFALGTHVVTCSATDGTNTSSTSFTVTVQDTTAPAIGAVAPSVAALWSPNHKMVGIGVRVSATDAYTSAPACSVVAVSSNEPIDGLGDGDIAPDWEILGGLNVNLRAERSGKGTGRIYTIKVSCSDTNGNASSATTTVTVPKSQK